VQQENKYIKPAALGKAAGKMMGSISAGSRLTWCRYHYGATMELVPSGGP